MGRRLGLAALVLGVMVSSSCTGSRILLSPTPSRIESLEGYARIWLSQPEASRSKFAFLLDLPDRGSFEVSDLLGRSLYRILITGQTAFLIIPAKKVYWKGEETEIIHRFLGFPLNLQELINLISGDWNRETRQKVLSSAWRLERDEQGRILSGRRGELHFQIEEFAQGTRFPRLLHFEHTLNSGRLKILKMDFNRTAPGRAFQTGFLKDYTSKTWDEIQDLLNHAD